MISWQGCDQELRWPWPFPHHSSTSPTIIREYNLPTHQLRFNKMLKKFFNSFISHLHKILSNPNPSICTSRIALHNTIWQNSLFRLPFTWMLLHEIIEHFKLLLSYLCLHDSSETGSMRTSYLDPKKFIMSNRPLRVILRDNPYLQSLFIKKLLDMTIFFSLAVKQWEIPCCESSFNSLKSERRIKDKNRLPWKLDSLKLGPIPHGFSFLLYQGFLWEEREHQSLPQLQKVAYS